MFGNASIAHAYCQTLANRHSEATPLNKKKLQLLSSHSSVYGSCYHTHVFNLSLKAVTSSQRSLLQDKQQNKTVKYIKSKLCGKTKIWRGK